MRDSSSSPGLLTAVTPTTCRPVAHSSRNPICANGRRCFGDNHSERSLSHRTKLSIDPLVPIGELHTVGLQCCGPDRWTTTPKSASVVSDRSVLAHHVERRY